MFIYIDCNIVMFYDETSIIPWVAQVYYIVYMLANDDMGQMIKYYHHVATSSPQLVS